MTATAELDPLLGTDFIRELVKQMRALDSYGAYEGRPVESILAPFVKTKDQRREIPVVGDPDAATLSRLQAFHNAIAALIEQECRRLAVPMISLTQEGFGRALITVGKLVVMDRTLRDVHRFGFESLSKMKDEADTRLALALELIGQHSEVAGL